MPIAKKKDKHFNKPITKRRTFKYANHRHKHFNEPITTTAYLHDSVLQYSVAKAWKA